MKIIGFAFLAAVCCLGTLLAAEKPSIESNVIAVSGEGEVETKPDTAIVDFSVIALNQKAQKAYEENNALTEKIKTAIKAENIKEEDIKTSGFNVFPEYEYLTQGRKRQFTGYKVVHRMTIKIRDISRAGYMMDKLIESGANEISGINFTVEDVKKYEKDARKNAVDDAKQKAESLAAATGVTLGKILRVEEAQADAGHAPVLRMKAFSAADNASAPVEPGQLKIYENVNVWYSIETPPAGAK